MWHPYEFFRRKLPFHANYWTDFLNFSKKVENEWKISSMRKFSCLQTKSLVFLRRKFENREVTKGKRLFLIVYSVTLVPNFRHLYEYMGNHTGFDLIDLWFVDNLGNKSWNFWFSEEMRSFSALWCLHCTSTWCLLLDLIKKETMWALLRCDSNFDCERYDETRKKVCKFDKNKSFKKILNSS